MLKNIDFEKMSYEEGLALVAETRKNVLKQGRVKQADMIDSLKQYWKDVPEAAKWSLYGAGAGGLGGLAASALTGKKKQKHYIRNMLTGGLLGGLAGYGGRLGYSALTDTPEKPPGWVDPGLQQNFVEGAQSVGNLAGMGAEAALTARTGQQLGHVLENANARRQLVDPRGEGSFHNKHQLAESMKEMEAGIDPNELKRAQKLQEAGHYNPAPLDKKTGRPKLAPKDTPTPHLSTPANVGNQARGVAELRSWLSSATDADIKAALQPGGRFHQHLPKGMAGGALDAFVRDLKSLGRAGKATVTAGGKLVPPSRRRPSSTKGGRTGPALVDGQRMMSTPEIQTDVNRQLVDSVLRKRQPTGIIGKWIGKGKLPGLLGLGFAGTNALLDATGYTNARDVGVPSGVIPEQVQKWLP